MEKNFDYYLKEQEKLDEFILFKLERKGRGPKTYDQIVQSRIIALAAEYFEYKGASTHHEQKAEFLDFFLFYLSLINLMDIKEMEHPGHTWNLETYIADLLNSVPIAFKYWKKPTGHDKERIIKAIIDMKPLVEIEVRKIFLSTDQFKKEFLECQQKTYDRLEYGY